MKKFLTNYKNILIFSIFRIIWNRWKINWNEIYNWSIYRRIISNNLLSDWIMIILPYIVVNRKIVIVCDLGHGSSNESNFFSHRFFDFTETIYTNYEWKFNCSNNHSKNVTKEFGKYLKNLLVKYLFKIISKYKPSKIISMCKMWPKI